MGITVWGVRDPVGFNKMFFLWTARRRKMRTWLTDRDLGFVACKHQPATLRCELQSEGGIYGGIERVVGDDAK